MASYSGKTGPTKTVTKAAPIEPGWHKRLVAIAKPGAACKPVGAPEAVALRNALRRELGFGNLYSYKLEPEGGTQINYVSWVARDPRWSGRY